MGGAVGILALALFASDLDTWGDEPIVTEGEEPSPPAETFSVLLITDDSLRGEAASLREALEDAIEHHTVLKAVTTETVLDAQQEKRIAACTGEPVCIREVVSETPAFGRVDLLLTISAVTTPEGARLIGAYLFDVRDPNAPVGTTAVEPPAEVSASRALTDQIGELFPPTLWGQVGGLSVDAGGGAQVRIGKNRLCVSPCQVEHLYPGRYSLIAEKRGFLSGSQYVFVPAGSKSVTMDLEPTIDKAPTANPLFWGALGAAALVTIVAAATVKTERSRASGICFVAGRCPDVGGGGSVAEHPMFWTAVGVDVVAASTALYLLLE